MKIFVNKHHTNIIQCETYQDKKKQIFSEKGTRVNPFIRVRSKHISFLVYASLCHRCNMEISRTFNPNLLLALKLKGDKNCSNF